ncbi:MAG: hypothetical protein HS132_12420 [Planctomycetia bacterium]|nr:hypothetical protein [Planctomycetia bacterium]
MQIIKSKLEELIKELPEKVEVEDVMYRIYMLQKLRWVKRYSRRANIFP